MFDFLLDRKITVVLADDHEVVRAGIRRLLSINKNIQILDEASNGEDAIQLVRYHKPDIALLDILMPIKSGIEATAIIKSEFPEVLVVMFTAFEDYEHLEKALNAGADGYLTKDIGAKDLLEAIQKVFNGDRVFSKSILNILQGRYTTIDNVDPSPITISSREQEILNYLAKGLTSPEIAQLLGISVRTVQVHRSNIIQKLGIRNANELVRYAVIHHSK